MRLATDSDKRAVGLAALDVIPNLNARVGNTISFANVYWPDYKIAVQNDAPAGYQQPTVLQSSFLENPLGWAEDNSTVVYWVVGGLVGLALIDSVL